MKTPHKIIAVAIQMREDQLDKIRTGIRMVGGFAHRVVAYRSEIDALGTDASPEAKAKIAAIVEPFDADALRTAEMAETLKPMFEDARIIQPPKGKGTLQ